MSPRCALSSVWSLLMRSPEAAGRHATSGCDASLARLQPDPSQPRPGQRRAWAYLRLRAARRGSAVPNLGWAAQRLGSSFPGRHPGGLASCGAQRFDALPSPPSAANSQPLSDAQQLTATPYRRSFFATTGSNGRAVSERR
eukprot:7381790-Prymnesium_polylepis.2